MNIKTKTIFILVPLILTVVALIGVLSLFFARVGITRLASRVFAIKATQLESYTQEQWGLLVENDLNTEESFYNAFVDTVQNYAERTLIEGEDELIFVYNRTPTTNEAGEEVYEIVFSSPKVELSAKEIKDVNNIIAEQLNAENYINFLQTRFNINGINRVGHYTELAEPEWNMLVTNYASSFYKPVSDIIIATIVLGIIAIIAGVIVVLLYSSTLVRPIARMLESMKRIIETDNLNERVKIEYNDEVGQLSKTFNVMLMSLEKASSTIKEFAFSSVIAKRNENKIRTVFQKYVPNSVINEIIKDPSRMLEGQSKEIAILFTDIRNFTSISEQYAPHELVNILNSYFEGIIDVITKHNGVVDKFIGDAVMAFFGSPMALENASLNALHACNEVRQVIDKFNLELQGKGKPLFNTGIGLNYGLTTVGNIGSEKKMDYTIIGDQVNLGSRLEGLTKEYGVDFIFSNSIKTHLPEDFPIRAVDLVQVKGKTTGEFIYTTDIEVDDRRMMIFKIHNQGFKSYLAKDFEQALKSFQEVQEIDNTDHLSQVFIKRCEIFISQPPSPSWDGIYMMRSK